MVATESAPFGALLQRHRVAAGMSQAALAERAGLSTRAISALKRGLRRQPYLETVRMLAEALRLDAEQRAAIVAAARSPGHATPVTIVAYHLGYRGDREHRGPS
jgi:transcriptional regulator with XRE-family HTH domain